MAVTMITLAGQYTGIDGSPASGTVQFQLSDALLDTAGNVVYPASPRTVTLDGTGSFSVSLPATNDPTTDPSGLTYTVVEHINNQRQRKYSIELDHATAAQNLADIAPATSVTIVTYTLNSVFNAHTAATTSVHGIADTSDLLTGTDNLASVANAQTALINLGGSLNFATAAALSAASVPTDNTLAYIRGYSTDNDGGQGTFRYSAASVATVDNGTVLAAAGGVGRWLRQYSGALNVRWFGATGDGVTDDSAAIKSALTAAGAAGGGVVLVPPGSYRGKGLALADDTTLWVRRGATITLLDAADNALVVNADTVNGNSGLRIVIEGTLDGNRANQTSESVSAIALQHVTDFAIELPGGTIQNGKQSCINLYTCARGIVSGGFLTGAGNDNLLLQKSCTDVTISGVTSTGTVGGLTGSPNCCGFEADDDCARISFIGCHSEGNLNDGFAVNNHGTPINSTGPFEISFTGCTAFNNSGSGFRPFSQSTTGPRGIVLAGCAAEGNTQDGFRVEGTDIGGVTLAGCSARANGRYGYYTGSKGTSFAGCQARDNLNYGFNLQAGADRATLSGCIADGNVGGFNVSAADSTLEGCIANNNSTGTGFAIFGAGSSLSNCRAAGHSSAANGRGFDILAGNIQLTGCVSTGNQLDGCLVRGSNTRVGIVGGRYSGNATNGVRSTAGADYIRVIGVEAVSNTSAQITLDAGGTHNVTANNITA